MQKLLARIALALFIPLTLLSGAEWLLRVTGSGYPTEFFRKWSDSRGESWVVSNPFYGYRYFKPPMARNPPPIRFAAQKKSDRVRIFVFGESAAMGDPVIEFSLARALSKHLNRPGEPERYEVINAAMTAISSPVIAEIALEAARLEPDICVIYMGNNEVIGPYGPGTVITKRNWIAALTPLRAMLTRLRLAGVLRSFAESVFEAKSRDDIWSGMEMFGRNNIAADDPRLPPMYRLYRRNIRTIIDAARGAGASVIVSTVAVNMTACAPYGSRHRAGLNDAGLRAWDELFARGIAAQRAGKPEEAERSFAEAMEIDDQHAELIYRMAEVLAAQKRDDDARTLYEHARDLDVQRFRADSVINGIVRDVSGETGATLVDAEALFESLNADRDLFLDHVHFSLRGLEVLSRGVAEAIATRYNVSLPDDDELRRRLFATPWGERKQAVIMQERRERPPFTSESGNDEWITRMRQWSKDCTERIASTSLDSTAETYAGLRRDFPEDLNYACQYGQLLAVQEYWHEAADVLVAAVSEFGGYTDYHGLAALALCQDGREEEAADLLLSTGKPYGYYLADAAMHLIGTLEGAGKKVSAERFASSLLSKSGNFPNRRIVTQWTGRR